MTSQTEKCRILCVKLTFMVLSGGAALLWFLIFNPLARLICLHRIAQLNRIQELPG